MYVKIDLIYGNTHTNTHTHIMICTKETFDQRIHVPGILSMFYLFVRLGMPDMPTKSVFAHNRTPRTGIQRDNIASRDYLVVHEYFVCSDTLDSR